MTTRFEKRIDAVRVRGLRSKLRDHRRSFNFFSKGREKLKILAESRENLQRENYTIQEKSTNSPVASFVNVRKMGLIFLKIFFGKLTRKGM